MRHFITRAFMKRIGANGALAEAAGRLAAIESYEPLPKFTTWELVCEEIVDAEYSPAYYEQVLAELYRRGLTPEDVTAMRLLAWETAGWLNFERLRWEWCSLSETHIELAINLQLKDGEITVGQAETMQAYVRRYALTESSHPSETRRRPRMWLWIMVLFPLFESKRSLAEAQRTQRKTFDLRSPSAPSAPLRETFNEHEQKFTLADRVAHSQRKSLRNLFWGRSGGRGG